MHIGRVAKKIGLTPDAIRFYERNALLPRPPRTVGGFRQYADADVERLRFIRQVQGLGFTLKEVRELLVLRGHRFQPCSPVRRRLKQKLSDVHRKLVDLQKLDHELRAALRVCNKKPSKKSTRCPLLSGPGARKPGNEK
jgi:DNA-binding transcriptional MerR regulator